MASMLKELDKSTLCFAEEPKIEWNYVEFRIFEKLQERNLPELIPAR